MQKVPHNTDQNNPVIRTYKEAVEKGKENQHSLPYGKKWAVTNLTSGTADNVFIDQKEAIKYAEKTMLYPEQQFLFMGLTVA